MSETSHHPPSSTVACSRGLILVVDDERLNRAILSRLVKSSGYETVEAGSGEEALRCLEEFDIDLILLDIVMPGMDGFDVLRHVRETHDEVDLPVLMVTGDSDRQQIIRAYQSGANDYLTKPIDAEIAKARIEIQLKLKHAQTALKASEERYALSAEGTRDGLWDWVIDNDDIYYSPRWKTMLGLKETDGSRSIDEWFSRIHKEDSQRVQRELQEHLRGEIPNFETQLRMRHEDGNFRWMLCRGAAIRNQVGRATRIAGSLTDITEGKVADALTGLPNRFLFHDRLERVIESNNARKSQDFAVFFLDLDDFKLINDSLGHESGDQLLVAVARRLEGCVRENDAFLARIGGDEFTVLLDNIDLEAAEGVAEKIIGSFKAPFFLSDGREIFTSVSIGISRYSSGIESVDDLVREADTAMYQAKAAGRSSFCVYDPSMQKQKNARLEMENELRIAIERGDIHLHYQPIVDVETGRLNAFEALIRWNHPQLGNVSPAEFIPIAEETGMIVPIGKYVIEVACQQLASWRSDIPAFADVRMGVNVSGRQFADPKLMDDISAVLSDVDLPPNALNIEITESTIMDNPGEAFKRLESARQKGIRVSIDDFGTGYSSLASLHCLPLDVLKIDQSFVSMLGSTQGAAIVRAILSLAENLHLDVVAEGVETEEQRRELLAMGCQHAQGYLFSRPLAPEEIHKIATSKPTNELVCEFWPAPVI